jgi:hypothetical protein
VIAQLFWQVLTNSGKETTLAATDAAAPALRRIERAGIAAATPISYHSRFGCYISALLCYLTAFPYVNLFLYVCVCVCVCEGN